MIKKKVASPAKKGPLADLKQIRKESRRERRGHHQYIASAICRAFGSCLRLKKDERKREAFYNLAKIPTKHRPRANLTIEVLCFAVGTRTEAGQRAASRWARVVEYLHMLKIPVKQMPAEIRERGGILKVYKEAVEKDPRPGRNRKAKSKDGPQAEGFKLSKQDWHWGPKDKGVAQPLDRRNDQLRPLQFDILASDMDTLLALKPGKKIRLRAERCRNDIESRSLVRVLKVILN